MNPLKSASKAFLLFHLGDTYMFMNEMCKTQATSREEHDVMLYIFDDMNDGNKRYGRLSTAAFFAPYVYLCATYRGYAWKFLMFYIMYRELDSFYDVGIYLRFFIYGPKYMRKFL